MPLARCGDHDVHYEDTGGDGHPVVLAHGYGMDQRMFVGQAALAPRWRVITWDARGHGGTGDHGRPFTYWDLARDLLGLMDSLGLARATVGGVSQGGFISLRAALLAPERVHSLVLFDTEAGACGPEDRAAYSAMFDALADHGPIPELVRPLAAQVVGDHPAAVDWVRRWSVEGVPLGEATSCLLGRDDIIDRLIEIECPALLVRGELDASIPVERMAVLAERMPNATSIRVVAGAGHSPPLTHPNEVNALIADFLTSNVGSAAA